MIATMQSIGMARRSTFSQLQYVDAVCSIIVFAIISFSPLRGVRPAEDGGGVAGGWRVSFSAARLASRFVLQFYNSRNIALSVNNYGHLLQYVTGG